MGRSRSGLVCLTPGEYTISRMLLRAAGSVAVLLSLAACSGAPTRPLDPPPPFTFSGTAKEAAVDGLMVNHRAVTVTEDPFAGRSKPNGTRETFRYLGLLPADPRGKTIRVRYERWRIVDGVESPTVTERAEIRLDLSQADVMSHRTWRIGIVEATATSIRYVAVEGPP